MKRWKTVSMIALMSLSMSMSAFAGEWKTGDNGKWWFDNGDGTYVKNDWEWIDGNGDGIAECYYFDEDGWMLTDTTTPDGYYVNENGMWMQDNQPVTRKIEQTSQKINDSVINNGRLPSVLTIERGRPIRDAGAIFGLYSAGQMISTTYDILTDNQPARVEDEAHGYFYIYDDRGFLVRDYYIPSYGGFQTRETRPGAASWANVYQYDDEGKLLAWWKINSGYGIDDASTFDPVANNKKPMYTYEYDSNGRLIGKGDSTRFVYDNYGRLTNIVKTYTDLGNLAMYGREFQYVYHYYDSDKKVVCEAGTTKKWENYGTDMAYSSTFFYDDQGRIIEHWLGIDPENPSSLYHYTYDDEGRIIKSEFLQQNRTPGTCSEFFYK